jgi:UDP-3-O-acyl-N-acetylglucosamine deacetylase
MDTVEQTIEQLLATIRDLAELTQVTINVLKPDISLFDDSSDVFQERFNAIMDKHNNQY